MLWEGLNITFLYEIISDQQNLLHLECNNLSDFNLSSNDSTTPEMLTAISILQGDLWNSLFNQTCT